MNILQAADATTMLAAAIAYINLGFSIIPLSGKKPANGLKWEVFTKQRADAFQVHNWNKAQMLRNIGLICGPVSGNLVVIDLDGPAAVQAFRDRFPGYMATFTVQTTRGLHIYLRPTALPPNRKQVGKNGIIEVRGAGQYVVASPSIHPESGKRYFVRNSRPIREPGSINDIIEWLDTIRAAQQKQRPAQPRPARPAQQQRPKAAQDYRRAAQAALYYECQEVCHAPAGGRNDTLNRAAYNLGQLVGDGFLSHIEVEAALLTAAAALVAEDGEKSVLATIQSGIETGIANPRSQQWQKRGNL